MFDTNGRKIELKAGSDIKLLYAIAAPTAFKVAAASVW